MSTGTGQGPILVGYDGSEGAKRALAEAIPLARLLGVRVVAAFGYEPSNPQAGETGDLRAAIEQIGEQVLAEAVTQGAHIDPDVLVDKLVVDARPADALIAAADELDARMIVIGHGGRSPMVSAILGSVAYRVLHLAEIPVLVTPEPED